MAMKKIHITKDGNTIRIRDMGDDHLLNTIRFIERRTKEGITLIEGGGNTPGDFWMEELQLEGAEVLDHFGYDAYRCEAATRGIRA